ncbi:MAG TPA: alpha/beta hydrolase [Sphingomicrobium sp.]|nr:alpha/beta hydrolase [Sphingomicrobium sp.]
MSRDDARFEERWVTVRDGLKLFARDYPGASSGPPLLCLHGLTRNSRDFEAFAERHSPRFRVLALDFRGRGRSDYDPLPARYTPLTYAADVIELLDRLDIPEAVFVGTSLGGLVTMTMTAMAPRRIAAAILNDVGPELDEAGLDRIKSYVGQDRRFASWSDAAKAIEASQSVAFPSYTQEDWLAMARRNCREHEGEVRFDYDMAIAAPFATSGAAPTIDMWPLFQALGRKPLMVVRGELSDLLSASALERMHSAVPDMKSVTVPDVGHAPTLDEREAVAAIDEFLDSLAG